MSDLYFTAVAAPMPADCAMLRTLAGLSQAAMSELVHLDGRQAWYRFEAGVRACDLARWELALLLTGQHPTLELSDRNVPHPGF